MHHAHLAFNYVIVRSNKIMVDNSDRVVRHIEVQNRQTDPNWQIANKIYRVENVLKEVYEDYEWLDYFTHPKQYHLPK